MVHCVQRRTSAFDDPEQVVPGVGSTADALARSRSRYVANRLAPAECVERFVVTYALCRNAMRAVVRAAMMIVMMTMERRSSTRVNPSSGWGPSSEAFNLVCRLILMGDTPR